MKMGLDQYAGRESDLHTSTEELMDGTRHVYRSFECVTDGDKWESTHSFYWRKHSQLHEFMRQKWMTVTPEEDQTDEHGWDEFEGLF